MPQLYTEKRYENFREIICDSAEKFSRQTAFVSKLEEGKYRNINFIDLKNYYYAFCTYLMDNGMLGKKIAVMGANCFEWALSYLCSATVGVVVPIDKELQPEDVNNFIESAECDMVITDSARIEKLRGVVTRDVKYVDFADVFDTAAS